MSHWRQYISRVQPWLAPLVVAAAVWGLGHGLLHHTPLTHDHPTHLFKAWHFYEKMLPELRLRGFSHYWVFGYPAGELVPFGEEVWVSLFRAVTFEKLSWLRTYGLALFGLIALIGASSYLFAKHYFGPLVGVISALFVLWDPGAWAQAGWAWFMDFGVWPNSMGIAFLLLSMLALDRLGSRFTLPRFVGAGVLVAVTLFAHQVAIPFFPLFVGLLLLDRWVRGDIGKHTVRNVLGALVFGILLSAFYVVPMVARTELTLDLGVRGKTVVDVAHRLVGSQVFDGLWHPLTVLGFVGAFVALKRRLPGALFLSLGTGLFVLASTDLPFSLFHLERVLPSLRKIEAARMLVGAKCLWFPLVAYAVSLPFSAVLPFLKELVTAPRKTLTGANLRWSLGWIAALLLVAPYVHPAGVRLYEAQIKKVLPAQKVEHFSDLQKVLKETKKLRASSDDLYRIVYDLPMHNHLATIAPVYDDTWIYKVGYTPTQTFWAFPMHFDRVLFQKLMAKYVVSTRKLSGPDYKLRKTFGKLRLYDFVPYEGKPFSFVGSGSAKLLEFESERIRLQVTGTNQESRLVLHVSKVDRFRATVNGKEVPISAATVKGAQDPFLMEIPVTDGLVSFDYLPRAPDILGASASFLAIPSLVSWRLLRRRGHLKKRAEELLSLVRKRLAPHRRALKWALILAVALLLGSAYFLARHRIWTRTLLVGKHSVFRDLPAGSMKLDDAVCQQEAPLVFRCDGKKVAAQYVSGLYGTHLCLRAPKGKKLTLKRRLLLGEALEGRYDPRPGPGRVTVKVNESTLGQVPTRARDQGLQFLRVDTRAFSEKIADVSIEVQGAALHCFDFEAPPPAGKLEN